MTVERACILLPLAGHHPIYCTFNTQIGDKFRHKGMTRASMRGTGSQVSDCAALTCDCYRGTPPCIERELVGHLGDLSTNTVERGIVVTQL